MAYTEKQKDEIIEAINLVYVDGQPLNDPRPAPPYAFGYKELDYDSGRGLDGVMQRNVLEHHAHTLDLKFRILNGWQMARLLQILDHPSLQVTAFDPKTNSMQTFTMYHGDLSPEISWYAWDENKNCPVPIYEEFKVSLIEY